MFCVYGLQPIGKPEGPVKIGFSGKTVDRIDALEPGALGERLHAIFLTVGGETYGEGRRAEKAYHDEFSSDRINREWFRFNPRMLIWIPDGTQKLNEKIRSPAENTIALKQLEIGDLRIFDQVIIQRDNKLQSVDPGDLSCVVSVQKITQRV